MQIGGGLGDEYMHAPALNLGQGGEKGKGGFIASLLDLLGINHQVAKEPKGGKSDSKAGGVDGSTQGKNIDPKGGAPAYTPGLGSVADTTSPMAAPPAASITILDDAAKVFTPQASKFGLGFSTLPRTLR